MLKVFAATLVLLVVSASFAWKAVRAQAPTRQARIFLDSSQQTNACGADQEVWQIQSGTCEAPGTTPWISMLRVVIGSTTINVPRANVTRLTTVAECSPGTAPCLRTNPVTLPAGNVRFLFVTSDGVEGAPSAAIPFSPVAVLPSAPATPRLVPVP